MKCETILARQRIITFVAFKTGASSLAKHLIGNRVRKLLFSWVAIVFLYCPCEYTLENWCWRIRNCLNSFIISSGQRTGSSEAMYHRTEVLASCLYGFKFAHNNSLVKFLQNRITRGSSDAFSGYRNIHVVP
jgi:hypothetical protein